MEPNDDGIVGLATVVDAVGDEWKFIAPENSIADVLLELVIESGFDAVDEVLDSLVEEAIAHGVYEELR